MESDRAAGGPDRVGVLGGSFDPVHNGHLAVARTARDRHELCRVIFVPARHQPHKPDPPEAPDKARMEMLRLATRDEPAFEVSDCELRRAEKSYTIDTVRELRAQLGTETEIFFIVGSDSVPDLPDWKEARTLLDLCTFVVAARPHWPLVALDDLTDRLGRKRVARLRANAIRETHSPVSATAVRERVAAGRSIRGLVPEAVARYIAENKLYTRRADEYDNSR
jgi:nicotinate-nucleotide adenylyltransferase